MKNPVKVAVLGSCVTRDNFNSKFNENYKDHFEVVLTQNQTSLISLMTDPAPYDTSKIDNKDDYSRWNVRTDFTKEFLVSLKEKQPEYLIIDFFADLHFGCIKLNDKHYLTNNRWKLWETTYYKELKASGQIELITLIENKDEYLKLWKESAQKFMAFMRKELPDCKVIINKARNVSKYMNNENEIKNLRSHGNYNLDTNLYNRLWNEMDNELIKKYKLQSIGCDDQYYTYEKHPWGIFYVHYNAEFYHNFLNKLQEIVQSKSIFARLKQKLLG